MKNYFDITEFGAIGDGESDSTSCVQAAIDEAAKCMGVVLVPPGRYSVGKLKLHGRGVSIVGTAAWSFREDGGSIFVLRDENSDCMIDISSAVGCTVKDICLDGGLIGNKVHGIKIYHEEYNGGGEEDTPTIEGCRIGRFSGDGLHLEHVWCFSVRHSMIHRNLGAGLYIDGWDGFILDNWFTANRGGGIVGEKSAASLTCTSNRIEWNGRGGMIFLGRGESFNIVGNFFDRSFGPALLIEGIKKPMRNITVSANIFRRSGARLENDEPLAKEKSCHVSLKNCTGTVVSANSCLRGIDDDGGGVLSPDTSFVLDGCCGCIVKDNATSDGFVKDAFLLVGDNTGTIIKDNI